MNVKSQTHTDIYDTRDVSLELGSLEELYRQTLPGTRDKMASEAVDTMTTIPSLESAENGNSFSEETSSSSAISPTSPGSQHVDFNFVSNGNTYDKERARFLTAKYPKNQMGLIRKRLAAEDWIDAELKKLYNIVCLHNTLG